MNQAWKVDQVGVKYAKQPLNDGVEFQIRSNMDSGRALIWREHIGGNQYRLRIRDNSPWDSKQWFIFDKRSRTIRPKDKRNYAISVQAGQGFKITNAVVRPFAG
jgi:hypothetical protein